MGGDAMTMTWSYDGWCHPCGKVTEHHGGRCLKCVGRPERCLECAGAPVTLQTVVLISEALQRGLTISPAVLQQVLDYVLANDPRMRRRV